MSKPTEMKVALTVDDLQRLWRATAEEAKLWRDLATGYPLRSQDPNTKRYDMMDDATKLAQRARYFKSLADNMERKK